MTALIPTSVKGMHRIVHPSGSSTFTLEVSGSPELRLLLAERCESAVSNLLEFRLVCADECAPMQLHQVVVLAIKGLKLVRERALLHGCFRWTTAEYFWK